MSSRDGNDIRHYQPQMAITSGQNFRFKSDFRELRDPENVCELAAAQYKQHITYGFCGLYVLNVRFCSLIAVYQPKDFRERSGITHRAKSL